MLPIEQRRVRSEFNRIGARYARIVRSGRGPFREDLAWLPQLENAKILDVACGPGTYSFPLSRRAKAVVGLDLAEAMLQCARRVRRRRSSPVFVQGDAGFLPFASGTFDLCLCAFSFAHFPRPQRVVEEMMRVLRPNGTLAIVDVLAPGGRRQRDLLHRLERSREGCYTQIRNAREFARMFSRLPLRCDRFDTRSRRVSFRQWIAASHLQAGSAAFRRAKRCFAEAAAAQSGAVASPRSSKSPQYGYTVARFLFSKAPRNRKMEKPRVY